MTATPERARRRFPERPGRLIPAPIGLNAEFYALAAHGTLHFQRCEKCGTWRHPPRFRCAGCGSERWVWQPSTGRGRIFTWTVTHQVVDPAFAAEVPYAVVVAEMDEGVRVVGTTLGIEPADLALDAPVTVVLEVVAPEVALMHFEPADQAPSER
jgi:uncharacterized protein